MRDELVTRNGAAPVKVQPPRPRKRKYWTVDEAQQFLESAKVNDDPLYAGYVLVRGRRRSELLGLAWDELAVETGQA